MYSADARRSAYFICATHTKYHTLEERSQTFAWLHICSAPQNIAMIQKIILELNDTITLSLEEKQVLALHWIRLGHQKVHQVLWNMDWWLFLISSDNRTYTDTREWKPAKKTESFTWRVRLQNAYLIYPNNLAVINIKYSEGLGRLRGAAPSEGRFLHNRRLCSLGALAGLDARLGWPDWPNLDEATAAKVRDSQLRIEGVTEAIPKERRMELEVEDHGELEG